MALSRTVLVGLFIILVLSGFMTVDGKTGLVGKFGSHVPVYKPLGQYIQERPTLVAVVTPSPAVSPTPAPSATVTTVYYTPGTNSLVPSSNPWDPRVILDTLNGTVYADKAVAVGPHGETTYLSQGSHVRADGSVIVPYMQYPQQLPGQRVVFVEGFPEKYAPFNPYSGFKSPWYSNDTGSIPRTPLSPFSSPVSSQTVMIPGAEGYWPVILW